MHTTSRSMSDRLETTPYAPDPNKITEETRGSRVRNSEIFAEVRRNFSRDLFIYLPNVGRMVFVFARHRRLMSAHRAAHLRTCRRQVGSRADKPEPQVPLLFAAPLNHYRFSPCKVKFSALRVSFFTPAGEVQINKSFAPRQCLIVKGRYLMVTIPKCLSLTSSFNRRSPISQPPSDIKFTPSETSVFPIQDTRDFTAPKEDIIRIVVAVAENFSPERRSVIFKPADDRLESGKLQLYLFLLKFIELTSGLIPGRWRKLVNLGKTLAVLSKQKDRKNNTYITWLIDKSHGFRLRGLS